MSEPFDDLTHPLDATPLVQTMGRFGGIDPAKIGYLRVHGKLGTITFKNCHISDEFLPFWQRVYNRVVWILWYL